MNSTSRIDTLDGIRALACMLVFLGHAGWEHIFAFIPGAEELGVRLFFALSGFLMAYLYIQPDIQKLNLSLAAFWGNFAIRRVFRIYPAFFAALIIYWCANKANLSYMPPTTMEQIFGHLALQQHAYIFWTIAVEMKFYLLFPFLVCALFLTGNKPALHIAILATLWLACALSDHLRNKLLLVTHLSYFLAGTLAGYVSKFRPVKAPGYAINSIFMVCTLLMALSAAHSTFAEMFGFRPDVYKHGFIFSLLTGLTVYTGAHAQDWARYALSNFAMRFIGKISFSIYLTHFLIMRVIKLSLHATPAIDFFVALYLTIMISYLLYKTVEEPGQELGRRLARKFGVAN